MKLEENRYQHFSTAVCAEVCTLGVLYFAGCTVQARNIIRQVLKSGVHAIGDMQYTAKKKKIIEQMDVQKAGLKRKMAYDK